MKRTNLWTLGGLSLRELARRTWIETWHDAVFGQAGRMAFYHFLAIFPSLVILLAVIAALPGIAPGMKNTIARTSEEFLPSEASTLVQQTIGELNSQMPTGFQFVSALAGALWAALNGTWALIYGLNRAYEVEERRRPRKLAITIAGLTFSLGLAGFFALVILFSGARTAETLFGRGRTPAAALHAMQWSIMITLLLFSFAVIYRYAPNLRQHEWRWSTPGALCALVLWVGSTLGIRFYVEHINDYTHAYGRLNRVVMLLLWLYLTNGAILIGGEMNSEIEKAAAGQNGMERSGS